MKSKAKAILIWVLVSLVCVLSGCGTIQTSVLERKVHKYQGDGDIGLTKRDYGLGMVTFGFDLQFPAFHPGTNTVLVYHMANLPDFDRPVAIEILTFVADRPLNWREFNQTAPKTIPERHRITVNLTEEKTGRVIAQKECLVKDLAPSHIPEFRATVPSIRNICSFTLDDVTKASPMRLTVTYDVVDQPVANKMVIMVTVPAPTA